MIWGVTDPEARVVEAMRALIDADRETRSVLVDVEQALERAIEALESGATVTDTLRTSSAAPQRRAMEDAFTRLVAARHEFRLRVISVCRDDGVRPWEIAKWWGISRQRVDRYIQELKKRSPDS
jgi:CHASE2 domain-containing sensor protein